MNRYLVTLTLLVIATSALWSQSADNKEFRYLFDGKNMSFSGFGSPIVMFGSAEGEFAVYNGGGGAFLVNQTFFLGGYGMGLSTAHRRNNVALKGVRYNTLRTNFGHGGFWMGYIHNASSMLHFTGSIKTGWGQLSLYEEKYHFDHYDFLAKDNVFVLIPQIEAELNLTHWFKINAGLGYQFVQGIGDSKLSNTGKPVYKAEDYNSPTFSLSFLFGGFGARGKSSDSE